MLCSKSDLFTIYKSLLVSPDHVFIMKHFEDAKVLIFDHYNHFKVMNFVTIFNWYNSSLVLKCLSFLSGLETIR